MKAAADQHKLSEAGNEMYEIARSMSSITTQLEEVNYQLRKQTVFYDICGKLKTVEQDVNREKSKLTLLAGALDRIQEVYFNTEDQIEEKFETGVAGSSGLLVANGSIYVHPNIGGHRQIRIRPLTVRKISTLSIIERLKEILVVAK